MPSTGQHLGCEESSGLVVSEVLAPISMSSGSCFHGTGQRHVGCGQV